MSWCLRGSITALLALVIAGFAGLDRWFYLHFSRWANTDQTYSDDFYHRTRFIWDAVRWLGHPLGATLAIAAVAALHQRGLRFAVLLGLCVLVADGAGYVAKGSIARIRPNQADSHLAFAAPFSGFTSADEVKTSFPSGEATAGFALATALALAAPSYAWLFYLAAAACAAARLVSGAHYLSDVAAGALLGSALVSASYAALHRIAIFNPLDRSPGAGSGMHNNGSQGDAV